MPRVRLRGMLRFFAIDSLEESQTHCKMKGHFLRADRVLAEQAPKKPKCAAAEASLRIQR
jgi:hypothetical protein